MKALKTIVATAVIVFTLTTVAMAGVEHFTTQSGQSGGTRAQTAHPAYSVTLTAAQLAQLMKSGRAATMGGAQQARHSQRHATVAHHQARSDSVRASSSGSAGTHHYEAVNHGSSGSHASGHHVCASQRAGCADGGGNCGD